MQGAYFDRHLEYFRSWIYRYGLHVVLYGSDTEALFAWGLAMTLTGALFCQIFAAPLARL